jgi:hypothetical protein
MPPQRTYRDLHAIAKYHRRLCRVVLFSVIACAGVIVSAVLWPILPGNVDSPFTKIAFWPLVVLTAVSYLTCIPLVVAWFWTYVSLLKGLRPTFLVWIIAIVTAFIPILSLINLVLVLRKSANIQRNSGYTVGRYGVDRKTLRHLWEVRDLPYQRR